MEEDNIYEYDDNNWPNKDLRTAAKGKESYRNKRRGQVQRNAIKKLEAWQQACCVQIEY